MARKQSILGSLKWDIGFLALLALLALGYLALKEPRLQPTESEITTGTRPPDRTEGDILLLLPDTPAAEAADFSELDCSYGWFNSLWQQMGSFATALTHNLSPETLAGRSVVIVPRRVVEALPAAGINALTNFARSGGQVVVEFPNDKWGALTGISTAGKQRNAMQITSVEGLRIHGPMREHLPDVPLSGKLLPAPLLEPYPSGPVLIEVDGQPGLVVQSLGQGYVYSLLFDFGCSVTAMHQGKPAQEMTFGPPGSADRIATADRAAHERMLTAHAPYADILKRALLERLSQARPLPRLWPFPETHAGAVMVSHPSPEMTRAALGYADWARKQGGVSTIYFAPDRVTLAQAGLATQTGAEIGLLWIHGIHREPATEAVGLGAIQPFARELSLGQQAAALQSTLIPGITIRTARTEGSMWSNDWATTFKQMAAAQIRVDNSFGPSHGEQFGYLFGTGIPYYPIDERGLPLPILEQPYVLHGASISPARLKRMLVNSEAYFHQSLVVSLPSDAMRLDPAPGILLGFRDLFAMARTHNHWVTTVGDFVDFLFARRQSVLTSQWSPSERRLTISVNVLGARLPTFEKGATPGIAFPRTFAGEDITRVVLDGKDIPLRALAASGSNSERILKVGPGRHSISIHYATPAVHE